MLSPSTLSIFEANFEKNKFLGFKANRDLSKEKQDLIIHKLKDKLVFTSQETFMFSIFISF